MKFPASLVDRLRGHYQGHAVCVTGGAGFIGGHLVDALLSLGANITVLDDLSNSTLDHLAGLIDLEPRRIRFVHGSILDDEALASAIGGRTEPGTEPVPVKTVFHLAALGSVPKSIAEPARTWAVNATGTLRVLEACRAAKVQRVVYAASSSAYGDQKAGGPAVPKVETQVPMPLSPYAAAKLAGEHLMAVYALCYGVSTVSLRYFNIFGPRQPADSDYAAVVAALSRRILDGRPPLIYGDGLQTRDFTFVGNAVLATLLGGYSDKPLKGEVINVGTGQRTNIRDLAEKLSRAFGAEPIQPVFEPARAGDPRDSQADISRARQILGYEPLTTLDDGLTETAAAWKRTMAGEGARG